LSAIQTLVDILTLEPIEVNLFRGVTPEDERNHKRIYGGQVIAQALRAAYMTVEAGRPCHSLQAYFIRPGDPKAPVLYEVERSREGRSFTTRRVIAIQHGEQILNLAASFHAPEPGYEHQTLMPPATPAEQTLTDVERLVAAGREQSEVMKELVARDRAIEIRRLNPIDYQHPVKAEPRHSMWFRASGDVGDDPVMNQCVLAYATDMTLLSTCARPHGESWSTGLQMASLDHVLWFHRPSRIRDWHLYVMDSPWSGGARGFNRGSIYTADGTLVASAAQEGLIRPPRK
jgi:acyl-CoA thioesterase-2